MSGTLTGVGDDGARPLTAVEFHRVMDRIAGRLDDEAEVADPGAWGRAGPGDMEVCFVLASAPSHDPVQHLIEGVRDRRVGL